MDGERAEITDKRPVKVGTFLYKAMLVAVLYLSVDERMQVPTCGERRPQCPGLRPR